MIQMMFMAATALSLVPLPGVAPEEGQRAPAVSVAPGNARVDELVQIRVTGLQPEQTATIRASLADARGREWRSRATFVADAAGCIDVASQAPTEGSYRRADPMGLLWSLKLAGHLPKDQQDDTRFPYDLDGPIVAKLELEVEGQAVATGQLTLRFKDPDVVTHEVRESGLVGRLFLPPGAGPHPALLVLAGSEGGFNSADAALLASHGYAALTLAYCKAEGLPDKLIEIPLESLERGIDWLGRHPSVAGSRLGVMGSSKGGELALLLGATFPQVRAVVAYVPSSVVWEGLSEGPPPNTSSWTWQGKPLPYVPTRGTPAFYNQFRTGRPVRLYGMYRIGLEDDEAVRRSAIEVEKISGPVLLISGQKDQTWPSTLMAEQVIDRLRLHGHPHRYQHLSYPEAGHIIRKAYLPPATNTRFVGRWAFGGTVAGNAAATADSWPRVLEFLGDALRHERSGHTR